MASQNRQYFYGSTGFTDRYDNIQTEAGNVTWLNESSPRVKGSEERISEGFFIVAPFVGVRLHNCR